MSKRFGFREVAEDDDWNLFWTDYSVSLERVMDMKRYQVRDVLSTFSLNLRLSSYILLWLYFILYTKTVLYADVFLVENQPFSWDE